MTSEKFSIEVDSRFIESLYGLADQPPPSDVTVDSLHEVVSKVKEKLSALALSSGGMAPRQSPSGPIQRENVQATLTSSDGSVVRPKTVLIVDDLGIITYQLEILFKKMGFEVTISQEINDAIEKYKKQDFGFAVIDLFIPTEREGFILLDELKKLALLCKLNTRIIVMTASSKPEYQTKCVNRGADFYIEKSPGWQKNIMDACLSS